MRDEMYRWLNGLGSVFRHPLPGSTNYLNAYDRNGNLVRARNRSRGKVEQEKEEDEDELDKDEEVGEDGEVVPKKTQKIKQVKIKEAKDGPPLPKEGSEDLMPFPMNRQFRSQHVLSEELKDAIYERVMVEGKSVRTVSAALGVEMSRVGAVVRLKAVEKEWEKQGKPIAFSYAKAVLGMLPTTPYIPHDPVSHESINDLPVHRATEIQIFHPVSESRHFTRRDAGKVFDRELKPAEDRVPHTELVQLQKWAHEGKIEEERIQLQRKKDAKDVESRKVFERKRREKEARDVKKVETERSMYRFQDIRVESVGYTGRGKEGVGARYGIAHQDRKKGQIKIPTSVR